ncbi:hypothetical protein [Streptomyces tauricus]|uniref:hypothetical protein n=1 Tax=Streptomyces tauricus TaxID=68274 RepID=UPI003F4B7E4D
MSWDIVCYAFPVLTPQITAATGWPAGATTAAFSPVGRPPLVGTNKPRPVTAVR